MVGPVASVLLNTNVSSASSRLSEFGLQTWLLLLPSPRVFFRHPQIRKLLEVTLSGNGRGLTLKAL
jgi:hypothetical protein